MDIAIFMALVSPTRHLEAATTPSSTDTYVAAKIYQLLPWAMVPFPPCKLDPLASSNCRGQCITG